MVAIIVFALVTLVIQLVLASRRKITERQALVTTVASTCIYALLKMMRVF